MPFAIVDPTTLTEAGVGEDVENIILKLLQNADGDVTKVLFICGGAFVGLEKIIERRSGQKSLGVHTDASRPPPIIATSSCSSRSSPPT